MAQLASHSGRSDEGETVLPYCMMFPKPISIVCNLHCKSVAQEKISGCLIWKIKEKYLSIDLPDMLIFYYQSPCVCSKCYLNIRNGHMLITPYSKKGK